MRALKSSLAAAALVCLAACPAWADEVRVLAAGAVQAAVRQLEAGFQTQSGHTLKPEFDTVGALRDRVLAGARADVVILSEAGMAALETAAKIDSKSVVGLGNTAVALAVRKGAPVPDISSAEALRRSLLAASFLAVARFTVDPYEGAWAMASELSSPAASAASTNEGILSACMSLPMFWIMCFQSARTIGTVGGKSVYTE